jgi:hypothetical protein
MFFDFYGLKGLVGKKKFKHRVVSVPLGVRFSAQHCLWTTKGKRLYHVTQKAHDPIPVGLGELDAWVVRDNFLSAKSDDEILQFLRNTGMFWRTAESPGRWDFGDMRCFQQVITYLLTTEPLKWKPLKSVFTSTRVIPALNGYRSFAAGFDWTPEAHAATLIIDSTLGAMLASVLIDHLAGAKFSYCARLDCRKIFRIESKHVRKFCDERCGRLQSLHTYRERKREKKRVKAQSNQGKTSNT